MTYHFRKDLILENVAGANIVVALRGAWDEYPFAMHIAPFSAYIWKCIEAGKNDEEIINDLISEFSYSEETAEKRYNSFITYCKNKNFFLEESS